MGGGEPGHKGWDVRDRGVGTWGPGSGDERAGRELCESLSWSKKKKKKVNFSLKLVFSVLKLRQFPWESQEHGGSVPLQ